MSGYKKSSITRSVHGGFSVRMKGLEPPRPETLDPKSNAATNYATCAVIVSLRDAKVAICVEFYKYILLNCAFNVPYKCPQTKLWSG